MLMVRREFCLETLLCFGSSSLQYSCLHRLRVAASAEQGRQAGIFILIFIDSDRWGDLVFETESVPISWDGIFNGKQMSPGVYAYLVIFRDKEGIGIVITGDMTLTR